MVLPDSDAELPLPTRPGEAYIEQSLVDYRLLGPDAAVQAATGGAPLSDRCAIISPTTHTVLSHCQADPNIDTHPLGSLVLSAISIEGDIYSNGNFIRRYALVNAAGLVTGVVTQNAATPPANAVGFVIPSLTANVGDTIPLANIIATI